MGTYVLMDTSAPTQQVLPRLQHPPMPTGEESLAESEGHDPFQQTCTCTLLCQLENIPWWCTWLQLSSVCALLNQLANAADSEGHVHNSSAELRTCFLQLAEETLGCEGRVCGYR